MSPVTILELFRGDDGTWEAAVEPVRGGNDLDAVDDLASYPSERAPVRVLGATRTLTVYRDGERAFVSYDEALPG
ncbi:MAG: hypothetical protein JXR83_16730 [Deltaproteobacteria bacterium]|nr:hypothetical protein [Deltaproteobacteria bacterium]